LYLLAECPDLLCSACIDGITPNAQVQFGWLSSGKEEMLAWFNFLQFVFMSAAWSISLSQTTEPVSAALTG
jgi:hypothetical protein